MTPRRHRLHPASKLRQAVIAAVVGSSLVACTTTVPSAAPISDRSDSSAAASSAAAPPLPPPPKFPFEEDVDYGEAVRGDVIEAFTDVAQALMGVLSRRELWVSGELADETWVVMVDDAIDRMRAARPSVSSLALGDDTATELYTDALEIHIASLVVQRAATATEGELRREIQRVGARLRHLGDRVFDRAHARFGLLADLDLTSPVPDWTEFDLAPAPPLAGGESALGDPPTTDATDWREVAASLEPPSDADLREAAAQSDIPALLAAAATLDEAVALLGSLAIPQDDIDSDVVGLRLGLLLRTEAARLGVVRASSVSSDGLTTAFEDLLTAASGIEEQAMGGGHGA